MGGLGASIIATPLPRCRRLPAIDLKLLQGEVLFNGAGVCRKYVPRLSVRGYVDTYQRGMANTICWSYRCLSLPCACRQVKGIVIRTIKLMPKLNSKCFSLRGDAVRAAQRIRCVAGVACDSDDRFGADLHHWLFLDQKIFEDPYEMTGARLDELGASIGGQIYDFHHLELYDMTYLPKLHY